MEKTKITCFEFDFEHNIVEFILNKGIIHFSMKELISMKLKKKINYVSLLMFVGGIGLLNSYTLEFVNIDIVHYLLILSNLVFFMFYNEFFYKPIYALKISKKDNDFLFIIDDSDIFMDFMHLKEYISQTKII